jgi:DNA-binding CsgD family transcriptional regulator
VNQQTIRCTRDGLIDLARDQLDWITFATNASEIIARAVPFQRSCWHTVDPGSVLFTGSLNHNIECSGSWLAHHEYVVEDVNKWWFLARSGRRAGAMSLATHGDLSRSVRHRSHAQYGIGDELRGSFVADGVYWGAAGFLRDEGEPWFTEEEVRFLAALSETIAAAMRRTLVTALTAQVDDHIGPGVVVFDRDGEAESVSPAAQHWIGQMVEVPAPSSPIESKIVQSVAARARSLRDGDDPLGLGARARVRTSSGHWLLLYGTRLAGDGRGRTAVIIQQASPTEVAPLVALAYGLSERECDVTRLCIQGGSTKEMARVLSLSPYTVQDHLKSIFEKTGARSRGELVGQIFLEHFVPRWEDIADCPSGWYALDTPRDNQRD